MTTAHAALLSLALSTDDLDELARILRELIRGGNDTSARRLALTLIEAGAEWTAEDWNGPLRVHGVSVPTLMTAPRARFYALELAALALPRFEHARFEHASPDPRPRRALRMARHRACGGETHADAMIDYLYDEAEDAGYTDAQRGFAVADDDDSAPLPRAAEAALRTLLEAIDHHHEDTAFRLRSTESASSHAGVSLTMRNKRFLRWALSASPPPSLPSLTQTPAFTR